MGELSVGTVGGEAQKKGLNVAYNEVEIIDI